MAELVIRALKDRVVNSLQEFAKAHAL